MNIKLVGINTVMTYLMSKNYLVPIYDINVLNDYKVLVCSYK